LDLWEFGNTPTHVGSTHQSFGQLMSRARRTGTPGERFISLVNRLRGPTGGTEIGRALDTVIGRSMAPDVLLVTDGKSHALDVHALAGMGKRISVVLIGEDSLEANVGYLAALTGGEIFVVASLELGVSIAAALNALRQPCELPARVIGELRQIR